MNTKHLVILGCCFAFAIIVVTALYATTRKIIHENNSFLREYSKQTVTRAGEMDIGFNSYYVAGIADDHIYLTSVTAPFNLLVVNTALSDSQHVKIHIKGVDNPTVHRSSTVKISPPYFYLADGIAPVIYRGRIGEWVAEKMDFDTLSYFTQIVPFGEASFGIRNTTQQSPEKILSKVQTFSNGIQSNHQLLQKQIDGIFCTDGTLLYNDDLKRLIYLYYYRNEFIVADTNLNLQYRGHTIDTFRTAQLKIAYIESEKVHQLLEKRIVNLGDCTAGDYLYVRSNLLAKNDNQEILNQESVIDVYDLTNNTYRFSFSLRNYRDKVAMRDFMVFDNEILIALYGNYLVKYDLQPKTF